MNRDTTYGVETAPDLKNTRKGVQKGRYISKISKFFIEKLLTKTERGGKINKLSRRK